MDYKKILSMYEIAAPVVGRLLLGGLFLMAGAGKIFEFTGTTGYMESMGVPLASLALVLTIVLEIGAGLAIIVGFKTKLAAFLLAGFTILATLIFHTDFSVDGQDMLFMKNLMIIGGLLLVSVLGGGKCSIDK